jgi:hypothetical protein
MSAYALRKQFEKNVAANAEGDNHKDSWLRSNEFVSIQEVAGVSGFEPELQGFGGPPTAVILHPW